MLVLAIILISLLSAPPPEHRGRLQLTIDIDPRKLYYCFMKQTCFNCKYYGYYDYFLCALEDPEDETYIDGYVPDNIIENDFTGCNTWEWDGISDGNPNEWGF